MKCVWCVCVTIYLLRKSLSPFSYLVPHVSTIYREKIEDSEASKGEVIEYILCVFSERVGTSNKNWPTSANQNAVRLSCELLRLFVTEAVQRAATIAEAEGGTNIDVNHNRLSHRVNN
ncbi:putative centromere protein X [Helianthus anomalus]